MIWDRTRAWVIERREVGLGRVILRFEAMPTSLTQIAAIRRVVPGLAQAPPTAIRERVSSSGILHVGEYGYIEARSIERTLRDAGLPAHFINDTRTSTVIVDRDGPAVLLIEDEDEHDRTVQEMIAEGVPIVELATD